MSLRHQVELVAWYLGSAVLVMALLALGVVLATGIGDMGRVDCSLPEGHPDITKEQRQACREQRSNK